MFPGPSRMDFSPVSRRRFLATTTTAATLALLPRAVRATDKSSPTRWPVGCFNRPWTKWSYDETLDSIKAAGYQWTGLLTPVMAKGDIFTNSSATPAYLAALKQKIA